MNESNELWCEIKLRSAQADLYEYLQKQRHNYVVGRSEFSVLTLAESESDISLVYSLQFLCILHTIL